MKYEEAIEAVERHRRHLVDRRAIDTVEVSIELADVCLKALRGWQAVEKLIHDPSVMSVEFDRFPKNNFVHCSIIRERGLDMYEAPDPATAAIAAQEEA